MWQSTRIIKCIVYTLAGLQFSSIKCVPSSQCYPAITPPPTSRTLLLSQAEPHSHQQAPSLPTVPATSVPLSLPTEWPILGASHAWNHEMSVILCLANFTSRTVFQAHRVLQQMLALQEAYSFSACICSLLKNLFACSRCLGCCHQTFLGYCERCCCGHRRTSIGLISCFQIFKIHGDSISVSEEPPSCLPQRLHIHLPRGHTDF